MHEKETGRIKIESIDSNFEREPLKRPFGFKGGYITELWQSASLLRSTSGRQKTGLATQSVLWSDPAVFLAHTESGGNARMYAVTEYALQLLPGMDFSDPVDLQHQLFDLVYEYGRKITGNPELKKTFVLNALVSLDNAAWMLYAAENDWNNFDEMIPAEYRAGLSWKHRQVASIPLVSYNSTASEIKEKAASGFYFLKVKLGQPGTQEEMLKKDKQLLTLIHETVGRYHTPFTTSGKILYYLDANGRYETMDSLRRLIDHIDRIGALDQVTIMEEPFPEKSKIDVSGIPLRIAADESAHTAADVLERIQMGYTAIALKPVAKTLSTTLSMAKVAKENSIACFCADLTVNPILTDWNKNVAARLEPLPGLTTGLMESNGPENYKNWTTMERYHPYPDAGWRKAEKGIYDLGKDFYEKSGGILTDSPHYTDFLKQPGGT